MYSIFRFVEVPAAVQIMTLPVREFITLNPESLFS